MKKLKKKKSNAENKVLHDGGSNIYVHFSIVVIVSKAAHSQKKNPNSVQDSNCSPTSILQQRQDELCRYYYDFHGHFVT